MGRLLHELAAGSILLPSPRGLRHAPHPLAEGHPAAPPDQLLLQAQHLLNAGSAYGPDLHLPRRATNPAKLQYCFLGQSHSTPILQKYIIFPAAPTIPPFFHEIDAPAQEFLLFTAETTKNTALLQLSPLIATTTPLSSRQLRPSSPHPLLSSRPSSPHHASVLSKLIALPSSYYPCPCPCPQRRPRSPRATEHNHNQPSDIRQCFLTTESYLTII